MHCAIAIILYNFFRGTLPSYASQLAGMSSRIGSGTTSRGDGGGGGHPGLNNVVPNLQSMRRSSPNSSSQYSQWRIQKDLGGRCSWKFVAIFFVLLSVILVSALIYTTGKVFLDFSLEVITATVNGIYDFGNAVTQM